MKHPTVEQWQRNVMARIDADAARKHRRQTLIKTRETQASTLAVEQTSDSMRFGELLQECISQHGRPRPIVVFEPMTVSVYQSRLAQLKNINQPQFRELMFEAKMTLTRIDTNHVTVTSGASYVTFAYRDDGRWQMTYCTPSMMGSRAGHRSTGYRPRID